jgi:hypothetical protein
MRPPLLTFDPSGVLKGDGRLVWQAFEEAAVPEASAACARVPEG